MVNLMRTVLTLAMIVMCGFAPATEAVFCKALMLTVRPLLYYCAWKNNVTLPELNAIIANDLSNNTKNTQCLSLCFMNKMGMFDTEGNINVEASIKKFSLGENPKFVSEVVNACKGFKGADACETASMVYACYVHKKLL